MGNLYAKFKISSFKIEWSVCGGRRTDKWDAAPLYLRARLAKIFNNEYSKLLHRFACEDNNHVQYKLASNVNVRSMPLKESYHRSLWPLQITITLTGDTMFINFCNLGLKNCWLGIDQQTFSQVPLTILPWWPLILDSSRDGPWPDPTRPEHTFDLQ